jgi:hypothetical protein
MAQVQKPDPKNMVKIGDLRKIVDKLKYRQQQLEYNLEDAGMVNEGNRADFIERAANEKRIAKYQGILDNFDKKNPRQDILSKAMRIGRAIKNEF